jgi:hypothetical protein
VHAGAERWAAAVADENSPVVRWWGTGGLFATGGGGGGGGGGGPARVNRSLWWCPSPPSSPRSQDAGPPRLLQHGRGRPGNAGNAGNAGHAGHAGHAEPRRRWYGPAPASPAPADICLCLCGHVRRVMRPVSPAASLYFPHVPLCSRRISQKCARPPSILLRPFWPSLWSARHR